MWVNFIDTVKNTAIHPSQAVFQLREMKIRGSVGFWESEDFNAYVSCLWYNYELNWVDICSCRREEVIACNAECDASYILLVNHVLFELADNVFWFVLFDTFNSFTRVKETYLPSLKLSGQLKIYLLFGLPKCD